MKIELETILVLVAAGIATYGVFHFIIDTFNRALWSLMYASNKLYAEDLEAVHEMNESEGLDKDTNVEPPYHTIREHIHTMLAVAYLIFVGLIK